MAQLPGTAKYHEGYRYEVLPFIQQYKEIFYRVGDTVHIHKKLTGKWNILFIHKKPSKSGFYNFTPREYEVLRKQIFLPSYEEITIKA